jgi:hypothetical protein
MRGPPDPAEEGLTELLATGIDLLAGTQHLLFDGPSALAEPKKLRYRLLHVAAKISRTARTTLRAAADWPCPETCAAGRPQSAPWLAGC